MSDQKKEFFSYEINGKKYEISVRIFNLDKGYNIILPQHVVNRIQISNNLDSFYPYFIVDFTDIAGNYTNKCSQTGEYIQIRIIPPSTTGKQGNNIEKLDVTFLINMHEIISLDPKEIKYRLSGPFYKSQAYGEHLNFATNKTQSQQSPYLLIKKILNLIDDQIQKEIPSCTRTMHFISDQNKTVKDHIKYCLDLGASQNDPPTYLYHKLLDGKPYLINRNFILDTKEYYCNHGLILPSRKGLENIDNEIIIYNFKAYTKETAHQFYQTAALQHRWTYDTIKRKWTYKEFLPQRYKQILSFDKKQNKKLKSVYNIKKFSQNNIRMYSENFEYNVYARLHNLQLANNCIQFYVQGNVVRDCGQLVNIICRDQNYNAVYGRIMASFQYFSYNLGK